MMCQKYYKVFSSFLLRGPFATFLTLKIRTNLVIPNWTRHNLYNASIYFFIPIRFYIVNFFSGPTSYTRGYMGQKFTFITSLSWHRMGSRLHPFWLYCSQQFYRMSNLQAIFVPSRPIHGWSIHFGK